MRHWMYDTFEMPSLRPGRVIHAAQRLSHGRRSGWLVSRLLALTCTPRPVRASIVPRHTCVSLLRCCRRCFGTSPTSGHVAQQSGFSAGSLICTMFRFGIAISPFYNIGCSYYLSFLHGACGILRHTPTNELQSIPHYNRSSSYVMVSDIS